MRHLLTTIAVLLTSPAFADKKPIDLGNEVIEIHDRVVVPAKSTRTPGVLPAYSDRATNSNEWTRAWLLLDIDASGNVKRLKFVHKPGLDLEPIAEAHAFATKFTPATNQRGEAVPSQLVWGLEWPAYWWLVHRTGFTTALPTGHLPTCRGTGPLNLGSMAGSVYRDCTQPDLAHPEKWGEWIVRRG